MLAEGVYNFVARAVRLSREDRERSAISPWSYYKSFYRFGIRSCLATNHKETLEDAIRHDVIVHFRFPGKTTG